ncbi:MAG: hypothetical protein Q7R95_00040 [bacterium]|nr:hypothetical protein [bacterium]
MKNNVGEAILILGVIYFGFTYQFVFYALIILPLLTWNYVNGPSEDQKSLVNAQINHNKWKAKYYEEKTNDLQMNRKLTNYK